MRASGPRFFSSTHRGTGRAPHADAAAFLAAAGSSRHDARMPIRMKEWGLKAYPGQSVQVPLSGISGMGEAARAFGRGLAAAGQGVAELMEMHEQVVAQGEMATLRDELQKVAENAQQQMAENGDAEQWETSWQQTVAPMVEPLLQKIPERRREHAWQLAQETLQRASLEARRQHEVGRLTAARQQWEARVREAETRGDAKSALSRLEEGREIFVPEGEMEARRRRVESRCCSSSWHARLQEDPVGALTAWRAEGAQHPEDETDARALREEMAAAGISLRRQLGEELAQTVLRGTAPAPEVVQGAVSAGLMPPQQTGRNRNLSPRDEAEWMRRADECEADEDSLAALRLQLATLPAPVAQRRRLLSYLEESRSMPQEPRRQLSAELWELYRKGAFGCAGDEVPQQRFCRLLNEGRRLLAEGDAEATGAWLRSLRAKQTPWLCFEA